MRAPSCCVLLLALLVPLAVSARQLQAPGDAPATPQPTAPEYFVEIRNGQFVTGCNYFKVAGWNQWEVVEAAAGAPYLTGASIPPNTTGPALVRGLITEGAKNGLNVMRTWAHSVNPQYALQTAPGEFDEATFRGLDYVLDEARKAGIKLILAFTSNWTPTGGIDEYVKWAGLTDHNSFFTEPAVKNLYKEFVTAIINRRNTVNGRLYRDDPVIMSWDLLNEPRCMGPTCPPGAVAKWYDEMATFVKTLDPNHLVSTGEEGFYACCKNPANPGVQYSEWAAGAGQDFIADHSSPNIDFATIHAWPDNWQAVDEQFERTWISQHAADATKVLKKPLLMEEWGKWVNATAADSTLADRTKFMQIAFDEIEKQMSTPGNALQGSAFWQWYQDGQEAAPSEGGGRGLFGIYTSDDAFKLVQDNAAFVEKMNTAIPGCTAAQHKAVTVGPGQDCKATWVDNLPGTGMEGQDCSIPINECVRGTDNCGPHASCIDTQTGFSCQCYWGYQGDGVTCAPSPALADLKSLYFTQPMGQACSEGAPVPWPKYSPGFVYDPMNSLKFFSTDNKTGSPTNVTLEECMIACQMADGCESFVFNDVQQKCFLARGQCPEYNSCGGQETLCNSTNDRGGQFSFGCGYWISYYRLDMDTDAACAAYKPDAYAAQGAQPQVLQLFAQYKAKNPGRFGGGAPAVPAGATATDAPTNTAAATQPVVPPVGTAPPGQPAPPPKVTAAGAAP